MEDLSNTDLFVFREKSRAFYATVKVFIDKLQSEDLPVNPRQLDEKNVLALVRRFSAEGCLRHESENYVPALISRQTFLNIAASGAVGPSTCGGRNGELQFFNSEQPLTYLQGRHRLEAARRFLPPGDRWWIVNLYSDDLSLEVKDILREADSGSSKYYDGDIFRQIRISTLAGDRQRRQKFLSRLGTRQKKNVLSLEAIPIFLDSLDELLSFAGLWPALLIGTFPRYSKLHCPEELTRYSRRIKETWTYIVGESEDEHLLLDANTVHILQGRCPHRSSEDRAHLQARMLAGDILPTIRSDRRRSEVFNRICSIPYVIFSLYTLAEDSKYLEPPIEVLKEILPNGRGLSMSQRFARLYNGQTRFKVQTGEFTVEDRGAPSVSYSSWASYCQLAFAAFRHFPFMGGQPPRKDRGEQGTLEIYNQECWWYELSSLATTLGYSKIIFRYPDQAAVFRNMAKDFLHRIRPARYYMTDSESERRLVLLLSQVIGDTPHREPAKVTPQIASDTDHCGWELTNRCGRPHERSFQEDEDSLFFDYIFSDKYTSPKRYMTSFAIKRDVLHAFFGTKPDDLSGNSHTPVREELRHEDPVNETGTEGEEKTTLAATSSLSPVPEQPLRGTPVDESGPEVEERTILAASTSLPIAPTLVMDYLVPDEASRFVRRASHLTVDSQYSVMHMPSPYSPAKQPPMDFTEFAVGPWAFQNAELEPPHSSMYVFGQQDEEEISFASASRLLFKRQSKSDLSTFTVLSSTRNGRFSKRKANPRDKHSMVSALRLDSESYFVARDSGKRLKMTPPTTILEEAQSNQLNIVVAVSQNNVQDLIHQFETLEESEEEL